MKKSKVTVTRTAAELAKALGLTPVDGAEIALRSDLNSKIVEVVQRKGLTHAQVALRHQAIIKDVWNWKYGDDRNALRIQVTRLRKKLKIATETNLFDFLMELHAKGSGARMGA